MREKRLHAFGAVPLVILFVAALFSAGCRQSERPSLEASYGSVSESEWNVSLNLKKGGVAEIVMETWEAGKYDKRDSEKTVGRWSAKGNLVTVEYNGITETFVYDENLSLAELGFQGGAPGLKQIRYADEKAIIGYYSLWKLPHKFGN
jgi:hypothetical protein